MSPTVNPGVKIAISAEDLISYMEWVQEYAPHTAADVAKMQADAEGIPFYVLRVEQVIKPCSVVAEQTADDFVRL